MLKVGGLSFSSWKENRKAAGTREAVGAGQLSRAGTEGRLGTAGTKALWLGYNSRKWDGPWGSGRDGEMEK